MMEAIQNRTMILGSESPVSSKWWWMGAHRNTRLPPVAIILMVTPILLLWLLAGGIAYTAGTVFFVLDQRLRFGHLVWHLLVLAGSGAKTFSTLQLVNQGTVRWLDGHVQSDYLAPLTVVSNAAREG